MKILLDQDNVKEVDSCLESTKPRFTPPVKQSKHNAISFNVEHEDVPDSIMILPTRSRKEVLVVLTTKGKWNNKLHLSEILQKPHDPFELGGLSTVANPDEKKKLYYYHSKYGKKADRFEHRPQSFYV